MAELELIYFDFPGSRGEAARIALWASGVPWKDTRIAFADWPGEKSKYPTGVPVLKLPSGREVAQSVAISRYAAKLADANLYPQDPDQALVVDAAMDIAQDALTRTPQESDKEVKRQKREEYAAGRLQGFCSQLAQMIEDSGGPFLIGDQMTIGDLVVFYFIVNLIETGNFEHVAPTYLDQWPKLAKLGRNVKENGLMVRYAARPQ
jgi:glutathione S-transferase